MCSKLSVAKKKKKWSDIAIYNPKLYCPADLKGKSKDKYYI